MRDALPLQLGFAVSVLGRPRLKSHDGRRWPHSPHLSVSLLYLRDILEYLREQDIRLYRMSAQLAPYIAHPEHPEFHAQIEACAGELAFIGELATRAGVRLSFHATPYTTLSSPDAALTNQSVAHLAAWARLLDYMRAGPEAVIVLHLGGVYEGAAASKARFCNRCAALPAAVRRRLALEHDDSAYSLGDALQVAEQTGLPVIFDYLHFLNHNPEGMTLAEALTAVRRTWPVGVRPKLHFSSPRTAWRAGPAAELSPPQWSEHADFVNPFEFIALVKELPAGAEADIMLEAKAKDLAVLRLRADLQRYAPDLSRRVG